MPSSGITPRTSASASLIFTASWLSPCQGPIVNAVASTGRISAVPACEASARSTDCFLPVSRATSRLLRGGNGRTSANCTSSLVFPGNGSSIQPSLGRIAPISAVLMMARASGPPRGSGVRMSRQESFCRRLLGLGSARGGAGQQLFEAIQPGLVVRDVLASLESIGRAGVCADATGAPQTEIRAKANTFPISFVHTDGRPLLQASRTKSLGTKGFRY